MQGFVTGIGVLIKNYCYQFSFSFTLNALADIFYGTK
jgi:hypothetical protein